MPADIYLNCAEALPADDQDWIAEALTLVERQLRTIPALASVAMSGPGLTTGASDNAALMLLFVTPGLIESPASLDEAVRFYQAIANGRRSAEQLVICDLRPIDSEARARLPWIADATPIPTAFRLYNPVTLYPFDAPGRIEEVCWKLSNDLAQRLLRVQAARQAAQAALAHKPTAPVSQVYLMEYHDQAVWGNTRQQLSTPPGLIIHPPKLPQASSSLADIRRIREARRRFLVNCQGLLLVRGSKDDDLYLLAADTLADLKEVGEDILPVCIDWVGEPAAQWPEFFRAETVVAAPSQSAQPGWADRVRDILLKPASA